MHLHMEQHFALDGLAQDLNEFKICCAMTFPSFRKSRFRFCEYEHF